MRSKSNIENFLKRNLESLDNDFQDDWAVFEQKLEQALYLRHIRRIMWMGLSLVFLIGLFVGMNIYEYYDREYVPRSQQERNMESYSTSGPAMLIGKGDEQEGVVHQNVSGPSAVFEPEDGSTTDRDVRERGKIREKDTRTQTSDTETLINREPAEGESPSISEMAAIKKPIENQKSKNKTIISNESPSIAASDEKIRLSRSEIGLTEEGDLRMKGTGVYSSNGLQLSLDELFNNDLSVYVNTPLRLPVEKRDVEEKDQGPYVSPLQEKSPWSYSVNVYPNFAFRKMTVDEEKTDLLHRDFIDAVQSAESGSFSLNIGLRISRRIGAITYINSGVEYITYKNEVVYNFTNFRDAHINPQTGAIEKYTLKKESELISFSDINTYNYLNFPLSISYQPWASDHIRLNIEAGGSYLHFMSAHGQTLNYKTLETVDLSTREFKKSMASFSFKVGANYYVSDKINIGFEPTIMYFTNSIYSADYPFYVIPYSVGLNLKLQVKLN